MVMANEIPTNLLKSIFPIKNETTTVREPNIGENLKKFIPNPKDKYALVFGNEVFGVSNESLRIADSAIEIPPFGTKHSFNISVSLGIVLWDYFSKIK